MSLLKTFIYHLTLQSYTHTCTHTQTYIAGFWNHRGQKFYTWKSSKHFPLDYFETFLRVPWWLMSLCCWPCNHSITLNLSPLSFLVHPLSNKDSTCQIKAGMTQSEQTLFICAFHIWLLQQLLSFKSMFFTLAHFLSEIWWANTY